MEEEWDVILVKVHMVAERHSSRRSSTKTPGELDAYSMDVASLNMFENQVIPIG